MKIAILGYGIEGESVYNYYRTKYPEAQFTAYDNNEQPKIQLPIGVEFVGGVKDFKGIDADIAIKTPAIAPWNVDVTGEVTTMTREFLKQCPAPVIGVTGTKGKGTTASLIESILDAGGIKTWLVGNIGIGAFDVLDKISPDDVVVYELSSFQLWDLDVSPHVAVVLGVEPEHLDVHKDIDDYVNAKGHIAEFQKTDDVVVYKYGNEYSSAIASKSSGQSIPYLNESGAHIKSDYFYFGDRQLCKTDVINVIGDHNKENACAAIAASWQWVQDPEVIAEGLSNFDGLPYRINHIRDLDGVSYYNDSYSSAPPATVVALKSLQQPTILIAGGYDRELDYNNLGKFIDGWKFSKKTLLIGQTASKISDGLTEGKYEILGTLEKAVERAHELAVDGDVVLLSPGCASFDMFPNFTARGQRFTELVEQL
ncbi:MAG: UDP-N-acetylmuramoyl-L-alanine--D-glutamate ligase [Candidatus Saccharimonadales bacterium]